jgi:toxin FitB
LKYLIDTNVLSEVEKPTPAPTVASWWRKQTASDLVLSALVILELRYGFELLPVGKRRERLEAWLDLELVEF